VIRRTIRKNVMARTPSKPPPKPAPKAPAKAAPTTVAAKAAARYAPKAAPPKPAVPVHPITSPRIKHLAGKATEGDSMTKKETQELGASVLRHIEPRKGGKP